MPRFRNRYFVVFDGLMALLTPAIAMLLRQDVASWSPEECRGLVVFVVLSVVVKLPVFYRYGLYNRYWRYAGINEVLAVSTAVGVTTTRLFVLAMVQRLLHVFPHVSFPLSVPLIDGLLSFVILGASRFAERGLAIARRRASRIHRPAHKRVLVVGAGDAGSFFVQEMQTSDKVNFEAVAFVDDNDEKQGMSIHGVPVLGRIRDIPRIVRDCRVEEVIIAIPTAPGRMIREIMALCDTARVVSKTMPGMYELLSGQVDVSHLRNVEIQDLLRREPVKTDMASVVDFIRGRKVLVTGGGGSIGSELCRQILRSGPSDLIVLGHGENSVYEVTNELLGLLAKAGKTNPFEERPPVVHPVIADVRFPARLRAVFAEYRPDIVFHAAAHKHVPLMELNVAEAVTNNILGTRHLLDASLETDVKHFVLISTDKAVNPTSMMGVCKRVAELLVRRAALTSGRAYVAVRFGNVLGSRGSVVLNFRRQIAAGGPVTVTHPDMKRYFMLIPEAVQLVLQAAVLGKGGEVFMLEMGDPVRIVDLARDMIRLSGLEVGRDVEISFVGVRPGEKLFEELFGPGENYQPTPHEKIFVASHASTFLPPRLDEQIAALEAATHRQSRDETIRCLKDLVPEYDPAASAPKPSSTDDPLRTLVPG